MAAGELLAESIRDEILATAEREFGWKTVSHEQNHLGYRNLKWRVETDQGLVFVKQFSPVRYPKRRLPAVETALAHQQRLHAQGIPCPRPYAKGERLIHETPSGEHFMIMSLCEGEQVKPGLVRAAQMHHLGEVAGRMHHFLNQIELQPGPMQWEIPQRDQLLQDWSERYAHARTEQDGDSLPGLERQRAIIERVDLALIASAQAGWAHWDLWVDNLLFTPAGVAAVLDFDRLRFIYPDMDVARAILSGAVTGGQMRTEAAHALVQGYRQQHPWQTGQLVQALRLLWCLELEWVRPLASSDKNAIRFREEILWLESRWDELDDLFGAW